MKKSVLLIGPILCAIALQGGVKRFIVTEAPVVKTVRFLVFAETNYKSAAYKQAKAKVYLSVWKYKGNNQELVWSSTLDKGKLKNYPEEVKPLFTEVNVYNIKESKETIVVGYKVVYDSKGSKLYYDVGRILTSGNKAQDFKIGI